MGPVRGCAIARIELPADPRAVELFDHLEARFRAFVAGLPRPLGELAGLQSTYLGSPGDVPFEGIAGLNPVLAGTPWLFWETFRGLDDEAFLTIAEAGTYFVLASIILDHLVDSQAEYPELMALFHQALYEAGVAAYRSVLPSPARFWEHFDRLAAEHLAGIAAELDCHANPTRLDRATLCTMAHGKVSPVVTTIAALCEASDQPLVLGPIEASLKHIAVASQLLDDIGDWRHDVEVGHLTYYLTQIVPEDPWQQGSWPSADELGARIDDGWEDVEHMRAVAEWLDESLAAVEGLECPGWVNYVEGYKALADEHLTGFVARHLVRVIRPLVEAESD